MNNIELKLTPSGTIDTAYYQHLAEQARAELIRNAAIAAYRWIKRVLQVRHLPAPLARTAH